MGKQGHGIGKGKPKMRDRHIGRALVKQQIQGAGGLNGMDARANANEAAKKGLHTVLEASDINDFVDYIEMEGKQVDVRRVRSDADAAFLIEGTTATPKNQTIIVDKYEYEHLPVPRKPKWTRSMTAEEVDFNERNTFVKWRRKIAELEESNNREYRATPFEKNIEVWRQLWRVLERSDMAVQVVDARNPLLYYTEDLVAYAAEHSPPRPMMLILNKADYLTEYQRIMWSRQLDEMGIKYVFYSASSEQKKVDEMATLSAANLQKHGHTEAEVGAIERAFEECDREEVEALVLDLAERFSEDGITRTLGEMEGSKVSRIERMEHDFTRTRLLRRAELVLLMAMLPKVLGLEAQERHDGRVCLGMVGFPNVGKSSCINSIMGVSKSTHGKTRVAVSSTPGKTKHFQTLMVNESLMLCDCPGLVFPSFMRTTGEMLCAGILPINQMRTYQEPANVITARVPMHLIDASYGTAIVKHLDVKDDPDRPPTGSEMLEAYCATKGYITSGTGRWDEFRACKEIVRDYCDGVLLYVCPPDNHSDAARWLQETEKTMLKNERVSERLATKATRNASKPTPLPTSVFRKADAGEEVAQTEFVFGDGKYDEVTAEAEKEKVEEAEKEKEEEAGKVKSDATSGPIFDDESSDEEDGMGAGDEDVEMGADGTKPKREHRKLKHWGKKNRKLKDKNPYAEENGKVAYQAFSTNRAAGLKATGRTSSMKTTRAVYASSGLARSTTGGGETFTRQVLPHHTNT
jgi:large subunit GTPase 1